MRWVVGLLLVCAAILKSAQLITEPAAALVTGRWLPPMQIGVELGVGLLALAGIYWRQLRWLALLLFSLFSAYSLYLAVSGAASCGCFGPIEVHPLWTFALDIAVVVGLLFPCAATENRMSMLMQAIRGSCLIRPGGGA